MANEFDRNIKDNSLIVTANPPTAGAANQTATIDLGSTGSYNQAHAVEVEVVIPAMAALADTKNLVIKLQHSTDNSTFSDVDPLTQTTVTGAGGVGNAAKTVRFRLPSNINRYVQFTQTEDAAGGNITASVITYRLLF